MKAKRRGGFRGSWAGGEIYWKDLGEAEVPADPAEPGVGSGSSGTTGKRGRKPKGPSGPTYYISKMVGGRRFKVSTGLTLEQYALTENPCARRCAGLMLTLARTLGAVHRKNVLHRDIKRDNIIIRSRNAEPVLVDFGIGAVAEATPVPGSSVLPLGTQEYVSPEAWRFLGENAGEPVSYKSQVSDELWALGVTFYWLLTNRLPFGTRRNPLMVKAILGTTPPAPHERNPLVPKTLSDVCMRMLEKELAVRFPDMVALCAALESALAAAVGDASWDVPLGDPDAPEEAMADEIPAQVPWDEEELAVRRCLAPPRRGQKKQGDFDSVIVPESVKIQERERFEDVTPGQKNLRLVPLENMVAGKHFELEVCFADGAVPECASFNLVVHPGLGMQEVKVLRQTRPAGHYKQVAEQAEAEVQQCRAVVRLLRAERGAPDGLGGAIASGLVSGTGGVAVKDLSEMVSEKEGNPLIKYKVYSYRALERIAVEVYLENPGSAPWTAAGAVLRGPKGEVFKPVLLWQPSPILPAAPGEASNRGRVVVEVLAMEREARGTYTLIQWDAERQRTVTLGNVTFP